MNQKTIRIRCLISALILLLVWAVAAYGESAPAVAPVDGAPAVEAIAGEASSTALATTEEKGDPDIDILSGLQKIWESTGFASGDWRNYVMIAIACGLMYLAIVKQFEPLLLLSIAFGMLLANLPMAGLMDGPTYKVFTDAAEAAKFAVEKEKVAYSVLNELGETVWQVESSNGGLLYYLYKGVKLGIYPPLIFLGVGAMTDFAPLIANPKALLLGAAAQFGIFITFIGAKLFGFSALESGAIGIIGGADGPTAIYVTTILAPALLAPIAVAAYSYMSLVPVIQPPIMRALTTPAERKIVMKQLRPVSKTELVIFPIMVTVLVSLVLPSAAPLVGMLMLGNLIHVSGVAKRLDDTIQNALMNIVTIFLAVTVGASTKAETFLNLRTLEIIVLGIVAFSFGTAGGILLAKLMNKFSGGGINPLIGSAGVSAVPMAARVSQREGQKENPANFLLMHAMGPNVAGVIGSAVAAGVFIALLA